MNRLPGPHKEAMTYSDLMLSFVRTEVKRHQENFAPDEPQDIIDYYLSQMEKVSPFRMQTLSGKRFIELCTHVFFHYGMYPGLSHTLGVSSGNAG